ncbi:MAG TPA: FAD:protein FMN transferase [Anaerolineales bacterium]|nr:FAD:protein FMN transferase [Anaerolineales bacterium]
MNTSVMLALEPDTGSDEGLRWTQAFIEECESCFSRFLPASEVSRLNASAGEWTPVSAELLDLLALSKAYYQETGGLFDPSVLPDLKRAGYDVSMDEMRKRGDRGGQTAEHAPRADFGSIELDTAARRVRMPDGMQVDLGGIAKGWIVQEAAKRLRTYGKAAAVNAGGDMYFAGLPGDGTKWQVRIENPWDPSHAAAMLEVGEVAVVTSSISKRTWKQAGRARHHIIDPRTGEPAEPEWVSVTAIAPDADLAEAYAKAFLIGGRGEATRLMLQRPRVAVLCIDPSGRLFASSNSKEYLRDDHQLFQFNQNESPHG